MDEGGFEDSFTHEIGDSSASNKKMGGPYVEDDSIVYANSKLNSRFDENSPPPTELVKARSNLMRQFDNDSSIISSV